jgi:GNAT superfamily N-acetyltransferase
MNPGADSPLAALRDAVEADIPAIVRMMDIFNREEDIPYTLAGLEKSVANLLANPAWGGLLIADVGGVPSGYALYSYGFDIEFGGRLAVLNELFVLPRHRGKGIGQVLLGEAEARVRAAGAHTFELIVRRENAGAQMLYRRNDFQFDPRLLMVKSLRPPAEEA